MLTTIRQQCREELELELVRYLIEPSARNALCFSPALMITSDPKRPIAVNEAANYLIQLNGCEKTTQGVIVSVYCEWWMHKQGRRLLRGLRLNPRPPTPRHMQIRKVVALEQRIETIYRDANMRAPAF